MLKICDKDKKLALRRRISPETEEKTKKKKYKKIQITAEAKVTEGSQDRLGFSKMRMDNQVGVRVGNSRGDSPTGVSKEILSLRRTPEFFKVTEKKKKPLLCTSRCIYAS